MKEKEEGLNLNLDYSKLKQIASIDENVIPVVVQYIETGDVLIVAYANQKAFDYTI